jgi:hypothetical protein
MELPIAENNAQLQRIVKTRYCLTKNDIEKYVKEHTGYLAEGFNSQFAQVLARRVFGGVKAASAKVGPAAPSRQS